MNSPDGARLIAATPPIAPAASRLLYLTMQPLAEYWMGVEDARAAERILIHLFGGFGNLFSHQFAGYAQVGSETAGLELSYPARTMKELEVRTLLQFAHVAGLATTLRMVWRSFPLQNITEAGLDEYFLAHLGVLPEFEGRGLGRQLLRRAEDRAREAGMRKITLTVDAGNARAIRLYAGAGFTVSSTVVLKSLRRRFGYHGYHHMAKTLE